MGRSGRGAKRREEQAEEDGEAGKLGNGFGHLGVDSMWRWSAIAAAISRAGMLNRGNVATGKGLTRRTRRSSNAKQEGTKETDKKVSSADFADSRRLGINSQDVKAQRGAKQRRRKGCFGGQGGHPALVDEKSKFEKL